MLFTELFVVKRENVPARYGYTIVSHGDTDVHSLGGKLSFRLQNALGGHWVWVRDDYRLVSDTYAEQTTISGVIEELWSVYQETYKDLDGVEYDSGYQASTIAVATYTVRLFRDFEHDTNQALARYDSDLGLVRVKRIFSARAWDVQGQPAMSISVRSNLIHKMDLASYHAQNPDAQLEGILVKDKHGNLKGEIAAVIGTVREHRERLQRLATQGESQRVIAAARDQEPVVVVKTRKGKTYDYVISALDFVVGTGDLERFGVDRSYALKQMKLAPERRWQIVQSVAVIGQSQEMIGSEYTQDRFPQTFHRYDFAERRHLLFGGGFSAPYNERNVLEHLKQHGLYLPADNYREGEAVRVGVIRDARLDWNTLLKFLEQLKEQMEELGFRLEGVGNEKVDDPRRDTLERVYGGLKGSVDILLAFFSGDSRLETREGSYMYLKSIAVRDGIPSQVVYEKTLTNRFAIANVVLGLLAKTGNIPFILADPLEFVDVIVGIDIARESKKRLAGTINAAATVRVYSNAGEFLRYAIQDASLEGETLDEHTLQTLLPYGDFTGKRVAIHRDGYFRGNEKLVLQQWGERIGAEFYPIEVIKSGAPRLYNWNGSKPGIPGKGSSFLIGCSEAVLVSSLPPFKDGTPDPLQIRSEILPIEQAIDTVLSLTLLHYGSLRAPKLPVTLHYSDRIAGMILDGIKPDRLVGNVPYWL